MEYEIYIDSVFFSNFALNFLVLSLMDKGNRNLQGLKRRLLGSILGSLSFCVFLISPIPFVWLRLCVGSIFSGILMAWSFFKVRTTEGLKRNLEEILHYSLILGGAMFCLNRFLPFLNGWIGTLALACGSYEVIRRVKKKWSRQKTSVTNGVLKDSGTTVFVRTLLDTGNGLIEPISGKPVCVIQKDIALRLWEDLDTRGFRAIPYHSVGCNAGILRGYKVEQIVLDYEGRKITLTDIYLAVTEGMLGNKGDYEMIMNPAIFECV